MDFYKTSSPDWYSLLKKNALDNRSNPTHAEKIIWNLLREKKFGVKFRRQHIIGDYIVDFICLKTKTIIEIDGDYHNTEEQQVYDKERTKFLNNLGFSVIRFTNKEVLTNIDFIIETISQSLQSI